MSAEVSVLGIHWQPSFALKPFMPFNGDDVWRPKPAWFNTGVGVDATTLFLRGHHVAQEGFIIPQVSRFHTHLSIHPCFIYYY
jgi:hypothetical protein